MVGTIRSAVEMMAEDKNIFADLSLSFKCEWYSRKVHDLTPATLALGNLG